MVKGTVKRPQSTGQQKQASKRGRHPSPDPPSGNSTSTSRVWLPVEVIGYLLEWLDWAPSVLEARLVCKKWRSSVELRAENHFPNCVRGGFWCLDWLNLSVADRLCFLSLPRFSTEVQGIVSNVEVEDWGAKSFFGPGKLQCVTETVLNTIHLKSLVRLRISPADGVKWESLKKLQTSGCSSSLKELYLDDCPSLSDNCAEYLGKLSALESLVLSDAKKIGSTLTQFLPMLLHLRTLKLSSTAITDESAAYLSKMTCLTSLNVSDCRKLTDAFVRQIFSSRSSTRNTLQRLDVSRNTNYTNAIGGYFAESELVELSVVRCDSLTNDFIEFLASVKSLRRISIRAANQITQVGLAKLEALVSLQGIDISYSLAADQNGSVGDLVCALANLPNLATLNVSQCQGINDQVFGALAKAPKLKSLNCASCWGYTSAGIAHLSALQTLTSLNLGRAFLLTDDARLLKYLTQLGNLENLTLTHSALSDAGLKELSSAPKLKQLNIFKCTGLTGVAVLSCMPNLTHLIYPFDVVTVADAMRLIFFPRLKTIEVGQISAAGAAAMNILRTAEHLSVVKHYPTITAFSACGEPIE